MGNSEHGLYAHRLRARQATIADAWCAAIAGTSFVPYSPAEIWDRLFQLTGRAIAGFLTEPFDADSAEQVGAALAGLHYTRPEALGRTQALFSHELLQDLAPEATASMVPRLSGFLEGLAIGFSREATDTLLREQEAIRKALLSNLRDTERQLREAHEHLEEQVEKRTRELQASEEKYRELLEEIDAVVVTLDREGAITYASPAIVRLFGGQLTDASEKPFHEFIYPADRPLALRQFARVAEGEASTSEFRVVDHQGRLRWVHASTRPVLVGGRVAAAHSVVTDITERKQAEEAQRESEERWRTLLDNSPDPVLTIDRQGRVLFVNYVRPESGLTVQDVLGQSALNRTLPDQLEAAMAVLDRVFERGESTVIEVALQRPDGSRVWYACHVGPVLQDGQTVALAVARDVTERKAIEASLQESEERWRTLVTNAPDLIYTVDREGRIQYVNRLPPQSGLVPGDVLGRSICEFLIPEHRHLAEEALADVFTTGTSSGYEGAIRRLDGSVIWYSSQLGPLRHGDGVVSAMLIARDITDRKRIEAALRESEERWRSLVTYAPDVVFTLDPDGRIQFVNHIPAQSGFSARDMLGRRISELVIPEHREVVESVLKQVFGTGESTVFEVAVQRPSGTRVWFAAHMGPIRQDNHVVAAMLISREVTERKRLEEMKDNLLRDVAHELRTPLTHARVSLEMVLESVGRTPADAKAAAKYGRKALDSIQRLAAAVKSILDLSRLEAGVGAFARDTIQLPELLSQVARDTQPLICEKKVRLELQVDPTLPPIRGDRERLWRVVHNLLDNAHKFSPAGEIVLSAAMHGGEILVGVHDQGRGILPQNLARVFDRFFREDSQSDGVGVGLPMCKTIVEAHGGRIWAESAGRGQGATFWFALPVPREEEIEAPAPEGEENE